MTNLVVKNWNRLERSEKLEIIEGGIYMGNTNEGFLMLRYFTNHGNLEGFISSKLDKHEHLCTEAVSQDTLISLFGEDYDFQEEDAEVILTWMESQI